MSEPAPLVKGETTRVLRRVGTLRGIGTGDLSRGSEKRGKWVQSLQLKETIVVPFGASLGQQRDGFRATVEGYHESYLTLRVARDGFEGGGRVGGGE